MGFDATSGWPGLSLRSPGAAPARGFEDSAPATQNCDPTRSARLNDLPDRLGPLHADELLIEPAVEVGQPVGVAAQLLQDRRVQVLDVEAVAHRGAAQLVRLAHAH